MSFDPNWMPWPLTGALGAMMAPAPRAKEIGAGESSLRKILDALHIGGTVTLAVFLWNVNETRVALVREVDKLTVQVEMLTKQKNPEVVDAVQTERLNSFEHRLDLVSQRIDGINQQIGAHIQHDSDRFAGRALRSGDPIR